MIAFTDLAEMVDATPGVGGMGGMGGVGVIAFIELAHMLDAKSCKWLVLSHSYNGAKSGLKQLRPKRSRKHSEVKITLKKNNPISEDCNIIKLKDDDST